MKVVLLLIVLAIGMVVFAASVTWYFYQRMKSAKELSEIVKRISEITERL